MARALFTSNARQCLICRIADPRSPPEPSVSAPIYRDFPSMLGRSQ